MKIFLISVSLVLLPLFMALAQPVPPDDPAVVPLTGLEYLIIGGVAYGVYRLRKENNSKNNEA